MVLCFTAGRNLHTATDVILRVNPFLVLHGTQRLIPPPSQFSTHFTQCLHREGQYPTSEYAFLYGNFAFSAGAT